MAWPRPATMPDRIPITEADLRRAINDPRYRTTWHPEYRAFTRWVENGFRALGSERAKGGTVKVRAYERQRDGKTQQVGAHTRSVPPGGLATPTVGPAAVAVLPGLARIAPPVIGGIITALPRPRLPGWAERLPPLRRPSLLDPPEEGGRRRGTVNGARRIDIPEEGTPLSGTEGGIAQSAPPEETSDAVPAAPAPRPSPDTVEGLIEVLTPAGANSKGVPNFDGGGDEDQLDADARALHPGPMTVVGKDGRRLGTLPDGRQIMIRPSSERSGGEPTIEISKPTGTSAGGKPRFEREYEMRYRRGRADR